MDDRIGTGPTTKLLSIGELARRAGLTVKTVRFWSDEGLVPPAGRTSAGYRLYGPDALARIALVRTLRELGVDLRTVQRVLAREVTVAEVAAAHADALDAQISMLRVHRTVLRAVARRDATPEEMEMMNKLAQMTATQRRSLVTDFLDEIFAGVEQGAVETRMRQAPPELPDQPSQEQVEAWVELAELISDPAFRARAREMSVAGTQEYAQPDERALRAGEAVVERAGQALAEGIDPASEHARPVVDELAGAFAGNGDDPGSAAYRTALADQLATFSDRRVERYWQLLAVVNGWSCPIPSAVPAYEWFITGLRAHA